MKIETSTSHQQHKQQQQHYHHEHDGNSSNNTDNENDEQENTEIDSNDGSPNHHPNETEIYMPPPPHSATSAHSFSSSKHHSPSYNINNNHSGGAATTPSDEGKEKRTRSRKWSDEEVDLFLKILGDPRYMFAASLENLVPKKRSNYEIFTNIRNVFRRELRELHRNRLAGFEYSLSLDLSIEKLRKKYSNLKVEWRRMATDRVRKGAPLVPVVPVPTTAPVMEHFPPEPRWYRSVQKLMTDIKVASQKVNNTIISTSTQLSSSGNNNMTSTSVDNNINSPYDDATHMETVNGGNYNNIDPTQDPHHPHHHQVKDEMLLMMDDEPTFVVISNRQSSTAVGHHDSKPLYSNSPPNNAGDAYNSHGRGEYPLPPATLSSSHQVTPSVMESSSAFSTIEAETSSHPVERETHKACHSPHYYNSSHHKRATSSGFGASSSSTTREGEANQRSGDRRMDFRYPYSSKRVCVGYNSAPTSPPPHESIDGKHNISELSSGLRQLAELQMKRQRMIIEADFKTYELFLRHKEQETEKNRAHELRLAEIYAQALTGVVSSPYQTPHSHHSSPPMSSASSNSNSHTATTTAAATGGASVTATATTTTTKRFYNNNPGELLRAHSVNNAYNKTMSEVEREMTSSPSFYSPMVSSPYNGSVPPMSYSRGSERVGGGGSEIHDSDSRRS